MWDPHYQKDIDQLERIQKNAARFITSDYKSIAPFYRHPLNLGLKSVHLLQKLATSQEKEKRKRKE